MIKLCPKSGQFYLPSFVLSQSNVFWHCLQIGCNLYISTFIHISIPAYKTFWMHRSEILPPLLTFSASSPRFSLNLYFWFGCTDSFIKLKNPRMCGCSTRNECVLLYADWFLNAVQTYKVVWKIIRPYISVRSINLVSPAFPTDVQQVYL